MSDDHDDYEDIGEVSGLDPHEGLAAILAVALQDMFDANNVHDGIELIPGATVILAFNVHLNEVRYPVEFTKRGPFVVTLRDLGVEVRDRIIETIPKFMEHFSPHSECIFDLREVSFRIIPPDGDPSLTPLLNFPVTGNNTIH